MSGLQPVIFQVDFGPYPAGKIAGFTPEKVRDLCNAEVKGSDGYPKKVARIPTEAELDANKRAVEKVAPPKEPVVGVIVCGPNVAGYNPGDIAGFPKSIAGKLIGSGDAQSYTPPPEDPARADEEKAAKDPRRRRGGPLKSRLRGDKEEVDLTK